MPFSSSRQGGSRGLQPHWVLLIALGSSLLGVAAPELRLGLLLGLGLFVYLWRSQYRDGFLWFSVFPGLLHLLSSPASWEQAWFNWFQTTFLLWIFGLLASKFQRQERWAVWPGLGLLVLYPSGLVLALLLGLHLLWGLMREWSLAQSHGHRFWWSSAGLVALVLSGAVLFLGFGYLEVGWPSPTVRMEQNHAHETPAATAAQEASEASGLGVRWVHPAGSPLKPWLPFLNQALDGLQLGILLIVALVLVLAFWGHRARGRSGRGSFLLPVLAVALTWAMLLAGLRGSSQWGGLAWPGTLEQPAASVVEWQDRMLPPGFIEAGYLLAFLMALGGFFLLLGTLYVVFQLRQAEQDDLPAHLPQHPQQTPRTAIQDPIREAYRTFEQQMQHLGWSRPPFVSSARFAEELAARQPQVKAPLFRLLELYQQVRYGGRSLPQHAQEARRLAEEIPRRFPSP